MKVDLPQDFLDYLPPGAFLCLTVGTLRVIRIEGEFKVVEFHSPNQPLPCVADFELQFREPFEQIHGLGVVVAYRCGVINGKDDFKIIGFCNLSSGQWLSISDPWKLRNNLFVTSGVTEEKKSMFGTKTVPFKHTLDSLDKFYRSLMRYCEAHHFPTMMGTISQYQSPPQNRL